jgi:glycosyltransferase involved in cell wall biosynthesis
MEGGMEQARASLAKVFKQNLPKERKIANVVSSNTGWRKNFPVIFEAWANVLKTFPDALLYVHSDPSGYFSDGINLFKVMELYGVPEVSVIFPPLWEYSCGALGTNFLNLVYNASNVHINACYGEGFGIPMIEAQAAGCPVVAPKFGGAGEVTKTGWLCNGKMINTVPGALQMMVDVNEMTEAILAALEASPIRKAVSEHVEEYEIDNVLEITTSFLEGLPCSLGC